MTTTAFSTVVSVEQAAALLRNGQVVALPTETVYGLAAAINQPAAIARVFALKQRPPRHPLIVHIADLEQLREYACDIPACVWTLAHHFWPGPLTFVLPRTANVPDTITGGQDTVALRMPQHPDMLAVIRHTGTALAAPSANPFGQLSPTLPSHVARYFGEDVPMVDGGACSVGLESTIVQVNAAGALRVLRPGCITATQLNAVLGNADAQWSKNAPTVATPGNLHQHYAPRKPLFLIQDQHALALIRGAVNGPVMLLGQATWQDAADAFLPLPWKPDAYARALYATLQQADISAAAAIAVEYPPTGPAWIAIHDRLAKAAYATQQQYVNITTVL